MNLALRQRLCIVASFSFSVRNVYITIIEIAGRNLEIFKLFVKTKTKTIFVPESRRPKTKILISRTIHLISESYSVPKSANTWIGLGDCQPLNQRSHPRWLRFAILPWVGAVSTSKSWDMRAHRAMH